MTAPRLRLYVSNLPGFECDDDEEMHTRSSELCKADTIHKIFEVLCEHCASFDSCKIFEEIVDTFVSDDSSDELKYPIHLRHYEQEVADILRTQCNMDPIKQVLNTKQVKIRAKYANFVSSLCGIVQKLKVPVCDLRLYVLVLLAPTCDNKELGMHLSRAKRQLLATNEMDRIFEVLTDCASFINYEIFDDIRKRYAGDVFVKDKDGYNVLDYSERLKEYLYELDITNFLSMNPKLMKYTEVESRKLVLKMDISLTSYAAKVLDLKWTIAEILGRDRCEVKLVGLEKGCLMLTCLISALTADAIFSKNLTPDQYQRFQANQAMWLRCGDVAVVFREELVPNLLQEFQAQSVKWLQCGGKVIRDISGEHSCSSSSEMVRKGSPGISSVAQTSVVECHKSESYTCSEDSSKPFSPACTLRRAHGRKPAPVRGKSVNGYHCGTQYLAADPLNGELNSD